MMTRELVESHSHSISFKMYLTTGLLIHNCSTHCKILGVHLGPIIFRIFTKSEFLQCFWSLRQQYTDLKKVFPGLRTKGFKWCYKILLTDWLTDELHEMLELLSATKKEFPDLTVGRIKWATVIMKIRIMIMMVYNNLMVILPSSSKIVLTVKSCRHYFNSTSCCGLFCLNFKISICKWEPILIFLIGNFPLIM